MSSFSLPSRYQPMLGNSFSSFLKRQVSSVSDALPGVISRGLSTSPTAPAANTGLPDVSQIDKPKSNMLLYAGVGVGGLLLLGLIMGKKRAPKAA